jgi:hypothetical protein
MSKTKFKTRVRNAVVHILGGVIVEDYGTPQPVDVLNENFLFDFKQGYRTNWTNHGTIGISSGSPSEGSEAPKKIVIKPVDVINELQTIPTPFSVDYLDEKISVLETKAELINQQYAKQEVKALIERLNNRKQYEANKAYFDQFQNTTDEKIAELLSKYELEMHSSDIFIPEFPNDAIQLMKDYTEMVKKISGKKPVYYVIAQPELFKKAYEKRDPILLVQSPFGFYYQILGAWDKEMMMLSEL